MILVVFSVFHYRNFAKALKTVRPRSLDPKNGIIPSAGCRCRACVELFSVACKCARAVRVSVVSREPLRRWAAALAFSTRRTSATFNCHWLSPWRPWISRCSFRCAANLVCALSFEFDWWAFGRPPHSSSGQLPTATNVLFLRFLHDVNCYLL